MLNNSQLATHNHLFDIYNSPLIQSLNHPVILAREQLKVFEPSPSPKILEHAAYLDSLINNPSSSLITTLDKLYMITPNIDLPQYHCAAYQYTPPIIAYLSPIQSQCPIPLEPLSSDILMKWNILQNILMSRLDLASYEVIIEKDSVLHQLLSKIVNKIYPPLTPVAPKRKYTLLGLFNFLYQYQKEIANLSKDISWQDLCNAISNFLTEILASLPS